MLKGLYCGVCKLNKMHANGKPDTTSSPKTAKRFEYNCKLKPSSITEGGKLFC